MHRVKSVRHAGCPPAELHGTNEGRHLPVPRTASKERKVMRWTMPLLPLWMAFRRPALSASRPSARWRYWTRYALCEPPENQIVAYALAFA